MDWLCLPRFDAAPVLARLLDDTAGHFRIAPTHGRPATTRRYRPFGLVLDTTWDGPDGTLVLSEAMALGRHDHGHQLGRAAPDVLLRHLRCTRGTATVQVQYAPRPEAGLVHPRLSHTDHAVLARGGATVLVLSTDLDLNLDGATARAELTLSEGQDIGFALARAGAWYPEPQPWTPRQIRRGLDATEAAWASWAQLHQRYEGPPRALVHYTAHTITTPDRFRRALAATRLTHVAVTRYEFEAGACGVAMPVFGPGGDVLAAIELTTRDLGTTLQPVLAALTVAARSLSRELAVQPRRPVPRRSTRPTPCWSRQQAADRGGN